MGKVAQLRTRPFQQYFVVVQQEIQFIDHRLNVLWKVTWQPPHFSTLDIADGGLDRFQRLEGNHDLHNYGN